MIIEAIILERSTNDASPVPTDQFDNCTTCCLEPNRREAEDAEASPDKYEPSEKTRIDRPRGPTNRLRAQTQTNKLKHATTKDNRTQTEGQAA